LTPLDIRSHRWGTRQTLALMSGSVGRRVTSRLRLEPIGAELAHDLWTLYQDPGIAAWFDGPWSRTQVDHFVTSMAECWQCHGVGKCIAYDRESGALIGRGGPSVTDVLGGRQAEIGWAVRQQFWGNGYATEIGATALDLVDEVLCVDEVIAFTEIHNRRSRAVMERLGMTYRSEIRRPGLVEGHDGIVDDAPFALYAVGRTPPGRPAHGQDRTKRP
jgi:RimJ/RimL family protein N-acetyltransferase